MSLSRFRHGKYHCLMLEYSIQHKNLESCAMENNHPDYSKKNKGALYVTFGNLEFTTLCVLVSFFLWNTVSDRKEEYILMRKITK